MPLLLAATEAPEDGSFLVSPSVGLMVWTLLVFGIALYILKKLAFPKIAEALDRRQAAIEDAIDTADRTKREADELLSEYRERLSAARTQADEIVSRARKTAESTEAKAVAEGKRKKDEMMEQTHREIESEIARATQDIRSEVADLTVMATEKVTRKSLTGDDQQRLVKDALDELDFSSLAKEGAGA